MSEKRYAGKVGLFVFIGIVLVGALMLNFSRGIGMFKPKYELTMRVRSVAGLKERSPVLLSGVQIGNVTSVNLDRTNKGAVVRLTILKQFPLHGDARFVIEQQGVLGDQFVTIYPGTGDTRDLKDGDVVFADDPFNLQDVARSTTDLLKRFDQLGATVGDAIERVNKQVLDPTTLSNLSMTIANFRDVSDRTMGVVENVGNIVTNNAPVFALALSNLNTFSRTLEKVAMEVDEAILTNRVELHQSMKNLRDATESLKQMTAEMQSGRGLVGGLLKDEDLRAQLTLTVSNLSVLSSNLNSRGLWSVLWKPKQPKNAPSPARGKSN
ncbi:MAG TPA: MlaD family protein [Methylomirabilota bacterium]|nr:MlaD family protein [Methylomirabilota bacterium]